MHTVRFDRLGLTPGSMFLDAGAGFGRHAFEAARRGAKVYALDYATDEVTATRAKFENMIATGKIGPETFGGVFRGDATRLPFPDDTFDRIVTSEVLEHIQNDVAAIAELHRVLKPGGVLAVTVPTWWPEKIMWMLSDDYHAPKAVGGHVRIYSATELKAKLRSAGLEITGSHHAHALHSPYWWLRCAVGPWQETNRWVKKYKAFLEWEIMKRPRGMAVVERALSPVLGKSYILYGVKRAPVGAAR